jgi:hypothetical protein
MGYFRILAAIPGFFLSSFFLMIFWGVIASKLGAVTISYPMAMLVTIAIWLVVAPLAAVGGHDRHGPCF